MCVQSHMYVFKVNVIQGTHVRWLHVSDHET